MINKTEQENIGQERGSELRLLIPVAPPPAAPLPQASGVVVEIAQLGEDGMRYRKELEEDTKARIAYLGSMDVAKHIPGYDNILLIAAISIPLLYYACTEQSNEACIVFVAITVMILVAEMLKQRCIDHPLRDLEVKLEGIKYLKPYADVAGTKKTDGPLTQGEREEIYDRDYYLRLPVELRPHGNFFRKQKIEAAKNVPKEIVKRLQQEGCAYNFTV